MSLFMPQSSFLPRLLASNICRFAVNNANFASWKFSSSFAPLQASAKTWSSLEKPIPLFLSLSLFVSSVIQRRGSRNVTSRSLKGLFLTFFSSEAVYFPREIIVIFPRHSGSLRSVKSCEITGHPFFANFSWTYCTGMEYCLGAISPMTTLENYCRVTRSNGWSLDPMFVICSFCRFAFVRR